MEHSPFFKKIYDSPISESVCEKAKLKRGDPPKIDFKKKGEPPRKGKKSISKAINETRTAKDLIS